MREFKILFLYAFAVVGKVTITEWLHFKKEYLIRYRNETVAYNKVTDFKTFVTFLVSKALLLIFLVTANHGPGDHHWQTIRREEGGGSS